MKIVGEQEFKKIVAEEFNKIEAHQQVGQITPENVRITFDNVGWVIVNVVPWKPEYHLDSFNAMCLKLIRSHTIIQD